VSKINRIFYRVCAAQPLYRSREARTLEWLRARLADDCYLSWSAGKDSMVMVHLCRRIRADLPILCSDSGVPFRWTAEDKAHIEAWTSAQGWDVRYFAWDKWGTTSAASTSEEDAYRKAVHAGQFTALKAWADEHGYTRRVDGMRAAEKGVREIFLLKCRGETPHSLHPLWQWSTDDVWTYTIAHGLPWLSIYDHLGPDARNGLIGRNGSVRGRLVYLKQHYPQAFLKACELFNARDYV
jgi:3'-phosphoadenosine 5'-phosphosulfate sulfotransferase (PAPS reductase)/FAD synthetase